MTSAAKRVYVVENEDSDRLELRNALIAEGVDPQAIAEFRDYQSAWLYFEEVLQSALAPTLLPSVVIADVGLGHEAATGTALLGRMFRTTVEKVSTGMWTIAVTAHQLSMVGRESPYIPHMLVQKDTSREWSRTCARLVAPLLRAALPTDTADNDFAPTAAVSPDDRIYMYEHGNALRAHLDCDGPQFDECFHLGLIQPHLKDLRDTDHPLLMHRGRYIPLTKGSQGKLARCLLRARTVLRARRQPAAIIELMSIDERGYPDDSPSGDGLPVTGLNNYLSWLRNEQGVRVLVNQLGHQDPKKVIPIINTPDGWKPPKQVLRVSDGQAFCSAWSPGPMIACPADLVDGAAGFMSRLQFILSDGEAENYSAWKRRWSMLENTWKGLY